MKHLHHKRAVVEATDTDVIMMCIYYITHMVGLHELCVTKMDIYIYNIYLPAHAIAQARAVNYAVDAVNLTAMLLSAYILTGCDTLSYPYRRGEMRAAYKATVDHLAGILPLGRMI